MKKDADRAGLADSWTLSPPNGELVRSAFAGKLAPAAQDRFFRNSHLAFATRTIARGRRVRPLPRSAKPLTDFEFRVGDASFDLVDYVTRNQVVGLLNAQDGEVLFEHYERGQDASLRWLSMSMAKSVSTTLVGCAVLDGFIESLDEPIARYVAELREGAYAGASIRHVLRMTSGASWDDTHTEESSERRHALELQIAQKPGALMEFLRSRPAVAAPGARYNYSLSDTHMIGALVKAATGRWMADYCAEKIWGPMGAESDAYWWLEAPDSLEIGGSGICATLRDYARFGLFMLDDGVADGKRTFPDWWIKEATAPFEIDGSLINYGYMWWPLPDALGSFSHGAYSARGIFGQYIYVNPARRLVVAVNSGRSKPLASHAILDNDFFNALAAQL